MERKKRTRLTRGKALDKGLCDKLVQSASLTIGHNVLITDEAGYVLSSNDKLREGTLHEASVDVVKTGEKIYHDSSAARRLKGTRPGMTIPLFVDSRIIGTIGITGSPQEISQYALLIQQMSQIFLDFQIQQRSSAQRGYQRQNLLREIVTFDNRTNHAPTVYNKAYEIGIDLNAPRVAILTETLSDGPDGPSQEDLFLLKDRIVDKLAQFFNRTHDFVCPQSETEYVVLALLPEGIQESGMEEIMQKCRRLGDEAQEEGIRLQIGVGSFADSLETLRLSYRNAHFALRVLQAQLRGTTCLSIGDVVLEKLAVSLSEDICDEVESGFFGNILQAKKCDDIMQIVKQWCQLRFHFAQTAAALHIHKSTLSYRFQRIKELYGLDLYDFDRVIALYLLIVRHKLI